MYKKFGIGIGLSVAILCSFLLCSFTSQSSSGSLPWVANYSSALTLAQDTRKPIFLLFTGEGWCKYCRKLDDEILNTSDFQQELGNTFVFVKMNFAPTGKGCHPDLAQQHEELEAKYHVNGYPTVVVLDPQEKEVLRTGYKEGGAKSFVSFIKNRMRL